MYDLQFECQYDIKVSAVTKKGVQGKPASTKLRTPVCDRILVKGDSLPPDCPKRGLFILIYQNDYTGQNSETNNTDPKEQFALVLHCISAPDKKG